jgi:hypothetical protein
MTIPCRQKFQYWNGKTWNLNSEINLKNFDLIVQNFKMLDSGGENNKNEKGRDF